MCAGWTSKLIPASRKSSWRRGEAEARISLGLASILKMCESVSRYVKEQALSKVSYGMQGASLNSEGCEFRLWAPNAEQVRLQLAAPGSRELLMERVDDGYFVLQAPARPGDRYFYVVDDKKAVPDPVSRLLPEGVHGPTEIVDPTKFHWSDTNWRGLPLNDYVIYELHIGTFTSAGTFDAAIEKFRYLKKLGVTVIEIMPVAAFPGSQNWGYDGVSPYA